MNRGGLDDLLEDEPRYVRPASTTRARVVRVENDRQGDVADLLATEEPMEIRLLMGSTSRTVAITMRTPGADFELAAGFLHGEQVVHEPRDIRGISYCVDRELDEAQRYNTVNVALRPGLAPDLRPLERTFTTTSACGVCGKASLEALELRGCPTVPAGPQVGADMLRALPDSFNQAQGLFAMTGGLHAAALFDAGGTLLAMREDVGRHNAVDKLVGWALLDGRLPLHNTVLLVSGRTSYEIVQKALVAGIPIVCAISAPSSLAVQLATAFGLTLVGFLRGSRFNIYAGAERIRLAVPAAG